MPKTLTIRVDEATYQLLRKRARGENRSLANFIETTLSTHLHDQSFVDRDEMVSIRADRDLIRRLRKGSRDAHRRRGSFVA
jgi:hypothetical protein